MSKQWYGSLTNRLEENRMFCNEIEVGTGMTEYYWSDTHAYEVTEVIDQKHVKVREYDHKLIGECYTNDWQLISNPENPEKMLTKRGNYWYWTTTVTPDDIIAKDALADDEEKWMFSLFLASNGFDREKILGTGKKQTKYSRANVSFGKATYHYDWSF